MSRTARVSLSVLPGGFRLDREGFPSLIIRWTQIDQIVAYKADIWAFDSICLTFHTGSHEVEIDEEMSNYKEVVGAMESHLTIATDWWQRVAFPPFAENRTVIFARS